MRSKLLGEVYLDACLTALGFALYYSRKTRKTQVDWRRFNHGRDTLWFIVHQRKMGAMMSMNEMHNICYNMYNNKLKV